MDIYNNNKNKFQPVYNIYVYNTANQGIVHLIDTVSLTLSHNIRNLTGIPLFPY